MCFSSYGKIKVGITEKGVTICNKAFPQFVQASIQGPARHRDSSLDGNTPHGAVPAFVDKT